MVPKIVLRFRTPSMACYDVNSKGQIIRKNMEFSPSDGCKFLGIQHVKKNWFISLEELLKNGSPKPFHYKNGRPQFTVRDLDHGTMRTWGNTHYHGLDSIDFMAEGGK